MILLGDDLTNNCSCSVGLAAIFIPVQLWGIISNILTLFVLVRSLMIRENTGKILANEAVCDIFINIMSSAMATANLLNRRIAAIGVPVINSLSCVRAYLLLGVSLVLYIGICHSLKYKIYVHTITIVAYIFFVWCFVPVILLVIYLEGTFFLRKDSQFLQAHYTSLNWWVGAFIFANGGVLPFFGIILCFYKTLHYQCTKVFSSHHTNSHTPVKIRLAKMSMIIFLLHMMSQLPSQVVSYMHVSSPAIVGTGYMLTFSYPSCKFFIFLYMLRYFRKTAKEMCTCGCKGGASEATQSTISFLITSVVSKPIPYEFKPSMVKLEVQ